jgi:hypothetical protein
MPKRTNPGDVANLFVRCYLADVGEALGGCSDVQWAATLEYFENRCAYTGETLTPASAVMDHAIPINREHGGLHLFGNLVPCLDETNKRKHHRHFRDFAAPERAQKIEEWLEATNYATRAERAGDMRGVCEEKYATIVSLCRSGREAAFRLFGTAEERVIRAEGQFVPRQRSATSETLPIELVCVPGVSFKDELLKRRQAWITVDYSDGRSESRLWNADNLGPSSNVIGNLRSRPEFRSSEWQHRGIKRVRVTLTKPM